MNKLNMQDYELAFVVQNRLGLSSSYFSQAYKRNIEIKADIKKVGSFLLVKLDTKIQTLFEQGYICCVTNPNETDNFEYTVNLTKKTLLGFYK